MWTILFNLCFAFCACSETPSRTIKDAAVFDGKLPPSDSSSSVDRGANDGGPAEGGPRRDLAVIDVAPPVLQGPLVGLPSQPGAHIAQIEALDADSWLELGPAAADPKWGRARGRAWGGRAFILAPDIRAAFFTGEGVHAYVKPDGHVMDDIWVYDINAHAWIAVYPGTNTAAFNQQVASGALSIDNNAQVVDSAGQPVPVHLLVHAWDFLSYDPFSRKFAMLAGDGLGRYFLGGEQDMDQGLLELEAQREQKTRPSMSPWFYDVVSGKFEREPITTDEPYNYKPLYPFFHYVTSRKQYIVASSQYVTFYDPTTRAWTIENDTGARPTGYDHGGCYDDKRDRIYIGPGANSSASSVMHVYDIKSATWSQTSSAGAPPETGTNNASVMYDTRNDVVTVFHYDEKKIFTYLPDADSWSSRPLPTEVAEAVGYPSHNAFYDPQLNAYFCHIATDSKDNGVIWVYRGD